MECLLPAIESHELFVLLNLLACRSNYGRGLVEVETKFGEEVVHYAFLFKWVRRIVPSYLLTKRDASIP
jgi:hypothetical protein